MPRNNLRRNNLKARLARAFLFPRGPGAHLNSKARRVIPAAIFEGPPDRPQGGDPSAEFIRRSLDLPTQRPFQLSLHALHQLEGPFSCNKLSNLPPTYHLLRICTVDTQ